MSVLSFTEGTPHIGFSGVISAIMVYYWLQFPKTKIAFCFPLRLFQLWDKTSGTAYPWIKLQWIRLPIWVVFAWWIGKEIFLFFSLEVFGTSSVSHSGHLAGYLSGALFWFLFNKILQNTSYELMEID